LEAGHDTEPTDAAAQPVFHRRLLSKYVGTFEVMPLRWFPRSPSGKVRRPEIEAAFRQRQARLGTA